MSTLETNLAMSYEHYRSLMENPASRTLSMEFEGLAQEEFNAAVTDPRSAVVEVEHDGKNLSVPLAVPIEIMKWRNRPYYDRLSGGKKPVIYYNNLPDLLTTDTGPYLSALLPVLDTLTDTGGLLTTDHAHPDKAVVDRDLGFVASSLGFRPSKDLLEGERQPKDPKARAKPPVQHYLYAQQLLPIDRSEPRLDHIDFPSVYETAFQAGRLATERAVLSTTIETPEIDTLWEYYDEAFASLNEVDPVLASFSKPQLTEIMGSSEYLKFIYRNNHEITNVCVVTDVRNCPWMNQAYYRQAYPEAYASGSIYYSPCVVSKPDVKILGMSIATMGLLIKGFCEAGVEPVITFVCDEVSNSQVPELTERSVKRTGVLTADFSYPDLLHIFRAFSFKQR